MESFFGSVIVLAQVQVEKFIIYMYSNSYHFCFKQFVLSTTCILF